MNKTLLTVIIVAGLAIIFVVSRYMSFDTGFVSDISPVKAKQNGGKFGHWIVFTPQSKGFTVSFPRDPQHASETTKDEWSYKPKHFEIFAAEGLDNNAYMVQEITYPDGPDPTQDEFFLETALSEILASSNVNELEKKDPIVFQGYKALSFQINSGGRNISGVMFLVNKTLFVLTRIADVENKDEIEGYQHFIKSFSLESPSPPPPQSQQ